MYSLIRRKVTAFIWTSVQKMYTWNHNFIFFTVFSLVWSIGGCVLWSIGWLVYIFIYLNKGYGIWFQQYICLWCYSHSFAKAIDEVTDLGDPDVISMYQSYVQFLHSRQSFMYFLEREVYVCMSLSIPVYIHTYMYP